MNSFVEFSEIENEVQTTCQVLKENLDIADDQTLRMMMHDLSHLACALNHFASETDEFTCFDACQEYKASLHEIYIALGTKLDDGWLGGSATES